MGDTQTELNSLKAQLTTTNTNIATYTSQLVTIKVNLETANKALKAEIDTLNSDIAFLKSEIPNQQIEIANEAKNEKAWDDGAFANATKDSESQLMPITATLWVLQGMFQSLFSIVEGTLAIALKPYQTWFNLMWASINYDQTADQIYTALKGRYAVVVYVDANSYVSIYNAAWSVGNSIVDLATLFTGANALKGTKVGSVVVDVAAINSKTIQLTKITSLLKTALFNKVIDLFKWIKWVDDILTISSKNVIPWISLDAGWAFVLMWDTSVAKSITSQLKALGWTEKTIPTTNWNIINFISPDGLQKIGYREFASSQVPTWYFHNATLDIYKWTNNIQLNLLKEIKFYSK